MTKHSSPAQHRIAPVKSSECIIARSKQELEEVYRLRYTGYRRDESILPNANQMFHDTFDHLPNSFSFLARSGEEALATVRITLVRPDLDWNDSPVQHVYGDHEALRSMSAASYVEASRLVFAQSARRDAFVQLVGHMAALASFYDVEWLVACPRVEHAATYQRMFGFKPLAEPRQYLGVNFQTQLLATRRKEIEEYVRSAGPLTNAWSDALAKLTRDALLSRIAPRTIGQLAYHFSRLDVSSTPGTAQALLSNLAVRTS